MLVSGGASMMTAAAGPARTSCAAAGLISVTSVYVPEPGKARIKAAGGVVTEASAWVKPDTAGAGPPRMIWPEGAVIEIGPSPLTVEAEPASTACAGVATTVAVVVVVTVAAGEDRTAAAGTASIDAVILAVTVLDGAPRTT